MPIEILTMQDLAQLKTSILLEVKAMLPKVTGTDDKIVKSTEVCKMLRISTGTLQNLRKNKTIIATKIGGTWYYHREDIVRMLPRKK